MNNQQLTNMLCAAIRGTTHDFATGDLKWAPDTSWHRTYARVSGYVDALRYAGVNVTVPQRSLDAAWSAILDHDWQKAAGLLNAVRAWAAAQQKY